MSGYSQPIILNVDDNEIGRYAVTKTLEKAGFRVIETATGKDAIKRAPQCELVVLDVNLPDISGFEVCRRLKSDPTTSRIPVLHLSATYLDTDSAEQGLEGGAEAYLTHPVEPRVLIAYVKALLRTHSLENELVKFNRDLKAITACHNALLRARDDLELASEVCRILVEIGRYQMVWVGYAEQNEKTNLRPVACSGQDEGFLESVGMVWSESELAFEPTGAAIRTGKPNQIRNISDGLLLERWRAEAIRRGYESSLAIPLISEGAPFGAVTFYSGIPDDFSEERINFLKQFADDLSYGIANIRIRENNKKAQESVRESEEKYRLLFSKESDAVILTDAESLEILDVNEAAENIYGFAKEELLGVKISERWANRENSMAGSGAVTESGNMQIIEELHKKKNGTVFPVETSVGHFTWKGRTVTCQIIRDVTERKRAIEEREQLKWQLFQSQKMEALGTLVGGIAHDLNNMLQVILGYSQVLLSNKTEEDPDYDDLQRIIHCAEQQADLVSSLLMYAKKAPTRKIPVKLNAQVEKMSDMLFRTFPRMIEIDLYLAPDLHSIIADPSQINQLVMNLAINAKEAIRDHGHLRIETKNVDLGHDETKSYPGVTPGHYVMLSISDTGDGMNEQTLTRMFEPFFSTKQRGTDRGTGMGLAVVKGITEEHKGCITCESEPGKGTLFKLFFPASQLVEKLDLPSRESTTKAMTGTVLLVDDEPMLIDLGKRALASSGYSVISASNGIEAIDIFKIRKDEISLVVLDLIMPQMSGVECLKKLLEIDPSARIILVTGFYVEENLLEELSPYIKGIVRKPYKMAELNETVHHALSSM